MIRNVLLLGCCLLLGFAGGQVMHALYNATGSEGGSRHAAARSGDGSTERIGPRSLAAPQASGEAAIQDADAFTPPEDMAEFQRRIDEVLSAARAGSEPAAVSLWTYLSQCDGETTNELRRARAGFEREMEALERQTGQLQPDVLDGRRQQSARHLATAESRNALCAELGDQRGTALGWLELAMARGSKAAVQQVMMSLVPSMGTEGTSRYAERLVRLRDAAVQRLQHGDLARGPDAPRLMMAGYTSGLLPYSETERAGYAYAWWLARQVDPKAGLWVGPSPLEEERLSPQERAGAERIGAAAFEACCS